MGTFHGRMGIVKDRKSKDLTGTEEIKKRWQEYTEEQYKKGLNDLNNHNGVITYLEPDILELEVKGALGSITNNKASGSDGIIAELFQILKYEPVKLLQYVQFVQYVQMLQFAVICQQIWKTQQGPQDSKRPVFIPVLKKGNVKECSNYRTIVLISHISKVMLKILQARLQLYVN